MDDQVLLSASFIGFLGAGVILGRYSKASTVAELEEKLESLRVAYEALRAKYESLTDRDEKGRFVRREP
jgi:chaperonin cofactor prefoldin